MVYNPNEDGVTHIRLSPIAQTKLGRELQIGAPFHFNHNNYGEFSSILAFVIWYTEGQVDNYRSLTTKDMISTPSGWLRNLDVGTIKTVSTIVTDLFYANTGRMMLLRQNNNLPYITYEMANFDNTNIIAEQYQYSWYDNILNELSN